MSSPKQFLVIVFFITCASSTIITQQAYWNFASTDLYTSTSGLRTQTKYIQFGRAIRPVPEVVALGIYSIFVEDSKTSIDLTYQADTHGISIKIDADDGCKLKELGVSMIHSNEATVKIVQYDFADDLDNFINGRLVVSIPADLSNFPLSSSKAFISYSSLKFDSNGPKDFGAYVELFSDSIRVNIEKSTSTNFIGLKANIIVVSSEASSFSYQQFEGDYTGPKDSLSSSGTTIGSRQDYKARPGLFFSISNFTVAENFAFSTLMELGVTSNLPSLGLIVRKRNNILNVKYDALLLCANGIQNCLEEQNPTFVMGKIRLDLGEFDTRTNLNEHSQFEINSMLPIYMSSAPVYQALGVSSVSMTNGFRVRIIGIAFNSITIEIKLEQTLVLREIEVSYLLSSWMGLQAYYYDFTPEIPLIPGTAISRTYDRPYVGATELLPEPTADVVFSEFLIPNSDPSTSWSIASDVSIDKDNDIANVVLTFEVTAFAFLAKLAGFVLVFNSQASKLFPFILVFLLGENGFTTTALKIPQYSWDPSNRATIQASFERAYFIAPMHFLGMSRIHFTESDTALTSDDPIKFTMNSDCFSDISLGYKLQDSSPIIYASFRFFAGYYAVPVAFPTNAYDLESVSVAGDTVFCLQANFTENFEYAVIVTDNSIFNGGFQFYDELTDISRIQSVVSFLDLRANIRKAVVPLPIVTAAGKIIYHIQRLVQDNENWNLQGFTQSYYNSFPQIETSYEVAEGKIARIGSLEKSTGEYKTIAATRTYKYVSNPGATSFTCQIEVSFSGVINALYVNSQYILSGSSMTLDSTITIQSTIRARFDESQWVIVTIVGTRLEVTSLSFENCKNVANSNIMVDFSPFYTHNSKDLDFYINEYTIKNRDCPSNCLSCFDENVCYECDEGYALNENLACTPLCSNSDYPILSKYRFCEGAARSSAYRNSYSYNATESALTVSHAIQPYNTLNNILTIFYLYQCSYSNYPVNFPIDDTGSSLTEPAYHLEYSGAYTSFISTAEAKLDIKSVNSAPSLVRVIAYDAISGKFLRVVTSHPDGLALKIDYLNKEGEPAAALAVYTFGTFEIHFFLECETCTMSYTLEGLGDYTLDLFKNENMQLLAIDSENKVNEAIDHEFTGLSYIIVRGRDCDVFTFTIAGEYEIYAPKSFLFEDEINFCAGGKVLDGPNCICPTGTLPDTNKGVCVTVDDNNPNPNPNNPSKPIDDKSKEHNGTKNDLNIAMIAVGISLPLALGCCYVLSSIWRKRKLKAKPKQLGLGNDLSVKNRLTPSQDYNTLSNLNDQSLPTHMNNFNQNTIMGDQNLTEMRFKSDEENLVNELSFCIPQNANNITKVNNYISSNSNFDDVDGLGSETDSRVPNNSIKGKSHSITIGNPHPKFSDIEEIADENHNKIINSGESSSKIVTYENADENTAKFNAIEEISDDGTLNQFGDSERTDHKEEGSKGLPQSETNYDNSVTEVKGMDIINDISSTSEIEFDIKNSYFTKSINNKNF